MVNISSDSQRRHEKGNLVNVRPPFIAKGFGLRVVLDIVLPRGGCIRSDTCPCFVIPHPSRDLLDGSDHPIEFSELKRTFMSGNRLWH